jgi:flavodoxin I
MKGLIVYDSVYGNTEKIARAIYEVLGNREELTIMRVGGVNPKQFSELDLFIIGSPTQRFQSMPAISNLLKEIPPNGLKGVKVTAFDTRMTEKQINETPVLAFFVKLFGRSAYAAKSMAEMLKKKGGELIVPPEGFYVEGMEGPLVQGELERAESWAKKIRLEMQTIPSQTRS